MGLFTRLQRLISAGASAEKQNEELRATAVKRKIMLYARASFTQNGPGVRANLRRVLLGMSGPEVAIAMRRGWEKGVLSDEDFRTIMRRK